MTLLSLDISTKSTGWAIYKDNQLIDAGCAASASKNVYERITYITKEIENIAEKYHPQEVVAEEPEPAFVGNNLNTYRKLTFIHGTISIMLDRYNLDMKLVTSSHWRKKVGIKTGAGVKREFLKQADMEKAKELANGIVEITNDDIADAVLIGYSHLIEEIEEPEKLFWD